MRRATITTDHGDPDRARALAAAIEPDNTDDMTTRVDDGRVVTSIERATTGGLRATVDDYVVNLAVAADVAEAEPNRTDADGRSEAGRDSDRKRDDDANTNTDT